jgi:AcrR family transcriptional regulator
LFGRYGYNGVGIDDIMAAANLTRGGFYAHFRSKRDLFAATLGQETELTRRLRRGDAEQASEPARALIDFYLDSANRTRIPSLCPFVSLSADVARCGEQASVAYTETLRALVAEVARRIPAHDAQPRALAALVLCVGGVLLAQSVNDERLAADLLSKCRARALAELEGGTDETQPVKPGQGQ